MSFPTVDVTNTLYGHHVANMSAVNIVYLSLSLIHGTKFELKSYGKIVNCSIINSNNEVNNSRHILTLDIKFKAIKSRVFTKC